MCEGRVRGECVRGECVRGESMRGKCARGGGGERTRSLRRL